MHHQAQDAFAGVVAHVDTVRNQCLFGSGTQGQHVTRLEVSDLNFQATEGGAVHIAQVGCTGQRHAALDGGIKRVGIDAGSAQGQYRGVIDCGDADGVGLGDAQCAASAGAAVVVDGDGELVQRRRRVTGVAVNQGRFSRVRIG